MHGFLASAFSSSLQLYFPLQKDKLQNLYLDLDHMKPVSKTWDFS